MGKTYIETIKYMIVADFEVNGLVERPDVIGAIFGQSEGLLGSNLDIKELQQNGKIGRIEIEYNQNNNKVRGILKLPCSVSMVETAIIAASIESIEKVGPCDAVFRVKQIEDTRGVKRQQIKSRAIELLGKLMQEEIPDTRELMDEIMDTFKTKDIIHYGSEKLAAGPTIDSSNEIIVVEGRADVMNLLRYGFTNVIATGGARIPKTLEEICKQKTVTIFLDGDRGAEIQQQQLLKSIKVDYIARAPDGKEVEELTQKEINQALRRKIKSVYSGIRSNHQHENESHNNLAKQSGIVKATKFSVTSQNKIMPRSNTENKEFLSSKFIPKNPNQQTNIKTEKQDTFDQMLSQIPGLERVDIKKDNYGNQSNFKSKTNDFHDNHRQNNSHFQKSDNFSKPDFKRPMDNRFQKPVDSVKQVVDQARPIEKEIIKKEESKVNRITQHLEKIEIVDNNLAASAVSTPVVTSVINKDEIKQASIIDSNQQKIIPIKEEIKEPVKPKPIILPKLTDNLKNNFKKIIEEIKDKKEARILNEKLRRIGGYPQEDLEKKLVDFKSDKLFAIVTNRELTKELLELVKEKGAKFIVTKESSIQKDPRINIVTFSEIIK
ncbi:MAG: DNA primase DnaG [Candidatus ainarchaeum sp.]|nr:DNA primase DnaG [Candidatus ainarchaeum sp.]